MKKRMSVLSLCLVVSACAFTVRAEPYDLAFSTYLGGWDTDQLRDIATDDQSNIYITGGTESPDFPTTNGAYDTTHNGWYDVFVTKLTPDGDLVWSTFIGGPNYDRAYAIEVDSQHYVYVAGRGGPGFPVTPGAFQTQYRGHDNGIYGQQNAFVLKLEPDGSNLVWASYFGVTTLIRDFDLDYNGDLYVTSGYWPGMSPDTLPPAWVANAFQSTPQGGKDGVVAKIRSDGTAVLWATYLGGSGEEGIEACIRVDTAHCPYVLQFTQSLDMPFTPGAFDTAHNGNWDYYLAKLTADGSDLVYGTYFGGSQNEFTSTHNLGLDAQGVAYILGSTGSADYPVTPGAFDTTYGGGASDAAVSKISPDGTQLLASTFISGSSSENMEGIEVDSLGYVYFSGESQSADFPVTPDAYQINIVGGMDGVLVKLSPELDSLIYSTFMGGTNDDASRANTLDLDGCFFYAGWTLSDDFPLKNPYQDSLAGDWDLALAKFCPQVAVQETGAGHGAGLHFHGPNPSRAFEISYTLAKPGEVKLLLYDCAGRRLTDMSGFKASGTHLVTLSGADLCTGVYFLRFEGGGVSATQKLLLID